MLLQSITETDARLMYTAAHSHIDSSSPYVACAEYACSTTAMTSSTDVLLSYATILSGYASITYNTTDSSVIWRRILEHP